MVEVGDRVLHLALFQQVLAPIEIRLGRLAVAKDRLVQRDESHQVLDAGGVRLGLFVALELEIGLATMVKVDRIALHDLERRS